MELIELSGYLNHGKAAIAREFLVPKQVERNGLVAGDLRSRTRPLRGIVSATPAGGVRSLEREIGSIARKVARRKAEGTAKGDRDRDPCASGRLSRASPVHREARWSAASGWDRRTAWPGPRWAGTS